MTTHAVCLYARRALSVCIFTLISLVESAKDYADRLHDTYTAETDALEEGSEEQDAWRNNLLEWRRKNKTVEAKVQMENGGQVVVMKEIQGEVTERVCSRPFQSEHSLD